MYVISDLDAVLGTETGLPLMGLYFQATGSKAATVVLMSAFAICMFGAACANITSSSRQMWAASRDNCYPFSRYWKQIHPKWHMPFNVVCLTGTLVSVSLNPLSTLLLVGLTAIRCIVIWPDIPWLLYRVLLDGRRMHCLHDYIVCHSTGHPSLERARQDITGTALQFGSMGAASEHHILHMGCLHRCSFLLPFRHACHEKQHELDQV
jgi:hypothetical protein